MKNVEAFIFGHRVKSHKFYQRFPPRVISNGLRANASKSTISYFNTLLQHFIRTIQFAHISIGRRISKNVKWHAVFFAADFVFFFAFLSSYSISSTLVHLVDSKNHRKYEQNRRIFTKDPNVSFSLPYLISAIK